MLELFQASQGGGRDFLSLRYGDLGYGDLSFGTSEGGLTGCNGLQVILRLSPGGGRFIGGLLEGELGCGELGLGGCVIGLGTLGGGDAQSDFGEALLAGGFASGEGSLNPCGGFFGRGDVGVEAFLVRVFAEGFLREAFEFRIVGGRDASFASDRLLGQVDLHCGGEAEFHACAGGDKAGLQFRDLGEVAALADLQLVILGAVQDDCRRGTTDGVSVQANRCAGRVGRDDNGVGVGRIDRGVATGERGAKGEERNRDAHGGGAWGVRIPLKTKSFSTPNRHISLRVDTAGL